MTSLLPEPAVALPPGKPPAEGPFGWQEPPIQIAPPATSSAGQEAIDLAARAGLHLDPWQQHILRVGMGEQPDGSWAAFEVAVNVPRQNGKGGIIEARELWGLFIGGERLILHSAHEFKTAKAAFKRIERLIRACPDLHKRVKTYRQTVGEEGIELHTGQVLRFIARSKGSGRGFTGDCNVMDEDMILGDDAMDALLPTMAAVPDPQIWYLGSAGIGAPSVVLGRLRRRALAAVETGVPDPSLAYFEWSVTPCRDECPPGCAEHDDAASDEAVLKSNPGVGYRLTLEKVARERATLSPAGYGRERLGVGDYPSDEADTWQVIPEETWRALAARDSSPEDPVAFAIDAPPERDHAAIAVAGPWRGGTHVEVVDHRPGMGWVVERAKQLHRDHRPRCWVVDGGGPAGSLIQALEEALSEVERELSGSPEAVVEIVQPKVREIGQACGRFYDAVADQSLSHLDQAPLASALAGAQQRPLGDAWAWARRGVQVDISPLVSATLAKWGLTAEVEEASVDPLDNIW
ncbi:terminase [Streptomyces jumonjinensis]|uniref:Terminase n=1 Tax=Streptomyces jumonjinensis TaxID=1945 RepID=A0A646KM71_STRJU|nr:terminase [Streptomyces jumonjinensis]MQT03168.1 terminase [Streptomyces jumonjinensis]